LQQRKAPSQNASKQLPSDESAMISGKPDTALARLTPPYCLGDVHLAANAVIADGVVLRAEPDCTITVQDGVCLGAAVIIHATHGNIELQAGSCIGSGVLIVGAGYVGRHACIGAGSTLIHPAIAAAEMVPPDCLVGDCSRQLIGTDQSVVATVTVSVTADLTPEAATTAPPPNTSNGHRPVAPDEDIPVPASQESAIEPDPWETRPPQPKSSSRPVIGQQQFEDLVTQMFPNRKAFREG
jgi:carbon dioxide concentrating mechanism protein CcmN